MPTQVSTTEDILLPDGTEVELRSLPITAMRKAMRIWYTHNADVSEKYKNILSPNDDESEVDNIQFTMLQMQLQDEQYDVLIKLAGMALESQLKGDKTDAKFIKYLEDTLDDPTVSKILDKCCGLKVGPQAPNQTAPTTE